MSHTNNELELVRAVYKNPNAKWAGSELARPKACSGSLLFMVHLLDPNSKLI